MGGAPATNPSRLVTAAESVAVAPSAPRFVSRGGTKLAAALETFGVDLRGRRVIDAGASTGGFTDCALQAGAARVVAIDVGRGQLHRRLLVDERVEAHERTNVRGLDPAAVGGPAGAVVADLSFVSLRVVADALLALADPGADLIWLVKPQFEAERTEVDTGRGVIADPAIWERTLRDVCATLQRRGAAIMGLMASPLRGADGNVEFLLHALAPGPSTPSPSPASRSVDHLVAAAIAGAAAGPEVPAS